MISRTNRLLSAGLLALFLAAIPFASFPATLASNGALATPLFTLLGQERSTSCSATTLSGIPIHSGSNVDSPLGSERFRSQNQAWSFAIDGSGHGGTGGSASLALQDSEILANTIVATGETNASAWHQGCCVSSSASASSECEVTFAVAEPLNYRLSGSLTGSSAACSLRLSGATTPIFARASATSPVAAFDERGRLAPGKYVFSVGADDMFNGFLSTGGTVSAYDVSLQLAKP